MYRPGHAKPIHGPPPFGPPPPHCPPFRPRGVPPPGHLPPAPRGAFSASAPERHFLVGRPPAERFLSPHCSTFSINSTMIALGGSTQISPPVQHHHNQVPLWNPPPMDHQPPDSSEEAGEEFLRCIAANKPLPDYLKGNMADNLAEAFNSTNVLKDILKSNPEFQKHATRSRSRSRGKSRVKSPARSNSRARSRVRNKSRERAKSRARSRSRSRARSRSRSRARSRIRARSKSRPRGRARSTSRPRSKSRPRGRVRSRSRARSKSRPRSRSLSQSRSKNMSRVRSKSRARRSRSQSSSSEKSPGKDSQRKSFSGNTSLTRKSLLEGLKLVMKSKELEERLPTLKDAILTIQASDKSKKVDCVPNVQRHQPCNSNENSTSLENDSMVLPHDRVGSDFSWLQVQSQEDSAVLKADVLEDEESFLYGNEDTRGKEAKKSSTMLFTPFPQIGELAKPRAMAHSGSQHHQKSRFSTFGGPLDLKQPQMTSPSVASANLDSIEYEKIRNILESLGKADVSEIMDKMQGLKEGKQPSPARPAAALALPALSHPNVRHALESLQSLIKVTKERREKRDASVTSQTFSDRYKAGDNEETRNKKQARIRQMESLMKELEGLLKQDGLSFLSPVIGFYCQKCEEFIGDLNSAENHAAIHCHSNSSRKLPKDKPAEDIKGTSRHFSNSTEHPHPSDRMAYHMDPSWRDERDQKSERHKDSRSQGAGQNSGSLKEEMRTERMLITVSRGLTPPPDARVKEQMNNGPSKVSVEDKAGQGKPPNDKRDEDESSDIRGDDRGKKHIGKSPKKKKEKKKKKKKKS